MGFSADQATSALRKCDGNINDAINSLLAGGLSSQRQGGDKFSHMTANAELRGSNPKSRGGSRRQGCVTDMDDHQSNKGNAFTTCVLFSD